jgi:ATP-dependent DNA helicase RecQ
MRAEGGRNPYLVDLGTVDGVIDLLPTSRPEHRHDIDRRYVALGPADVNIGFAGRSDAGSPLHRHIAKLTTGDEVVVSGRHIQTGEGQVVGRLAAKTHLGAGDIPGTVAGVMVRTLEQTPPEYHDGLKSRRWETVLVELVID